MFVQSSGIGRCLQSVQAQLAGFFPPEGHQIWNPTIAWQPVPVHNLPVDSDPLLRSVSDKCPRREQLWKEKETEQVYLDKVVSLDFQVNRDSDEQGVSRVFPKTQ